MKIGDYVRINKNIRKICIGIGKIINITQDTIYVDMRENIPISFQKQEIEKSSSSICKLLKVGDFIDNHCITEIKETTIYTNDGWFIDADDVENLVTSIVTKEQFEGMKYNV